MRSQNLLKIGAALNPVEGARDEHGERSGAGEALTAQASRQIIFQMSSLADRIEAF